MSAAVLKYGPFILDSRNGSLGMILGEPTHHIIFPVMAAVKLGVG
jgi:hypothetical protein